MRKTLPWVNSINELTSPENGAIFRLEPRQSLHNLQPPKVALGEHAAFVVDYYKKEFPAREDQPFIAYFKNATLFGRHFSILDTRRHAFEECFLRDRRWREGVPKIKRKLAPKKMSGSYLLAGSEFHNHYAHLFCDVLPRWKLFEEAGLAGQQPAILPPASHAFADEAWREIGVAKDDAVRWDDGCWQLDGLYFASTFKRFCSWTPESASWIRQKFNPGLEEKKPGAKLYYISRRNGVRPALNEDAILAALKPWGITVVEPDRIPLREQIELFSDAGLIIGPQGAGIQNCLWAPRGCRVMEFISPRFFSGVYWTLAESLGQPYGLVTGETSAMENPATVGSTFDPDLVNRAVEALTR